MAKKRALIISVSKYDDPDLDKIQFVKNDGDEMHHILTKIGYEIPQERKLVGKVDFNSMRLAINQFFQDETLNPDDTLLFYYSGHGDTDGFKDRFFCTTEYERDHPDNFGVPFNIINSQIKKSNSKRIIAILDCCFSGGLVLEPGKSGDPNGEKQAEKLGNEALNDEFKDSTGLYVLASSLSNRLSYQHPEKELSAFTNFIIEGLKGDNDALDEDGCVTPDTLDEYVFKKLKELGGKNLQKPQRSALVSGKLVLVEYPKEQVKSTQQITESLVKLLQENKIKEFNEIRESQLKDIELSPEKIKKEKIIEKILDFAEINLSKKDLSDSILKFIAFNGANLEGAILRNSNLVGTEFSHSNLNGADFTGAIFHEKVVQPQPSETAQFFEIPRQGTDIDKFRIANVPPDVLEEFTVGFSNCDLRKAKFIGINTYFDKSSYFCNLNFANSRMSEVDFNNSILRRRNFKGLEITYSIFNNADISNAEFEGANLAHSSFLNTICYNTNFVGAELDNCDFTKANLSYSILRGAKLNNSIFKNANLTGVDLSGAELSEADFTNVIALPISKNEAESRGAII